MPIDLVLAAAADLSGDDGVGGWKKKKKKKKKKVTMKTKLMVLFLPSQRITMKRPDKKNWKNSFIPADCRDLFIEGEIMPIDFPFVQRLPQLNSSIHFSVL